MPDLIVTIRDGYITIDGPLPPDYRLIVHNHSGDPDFYPYLREIERCPYASPVEEFDDDEVETGLHCFKYVEPHSEIDEQ